MSSTDSLGSTRTTRGGALLACLVAACVLAIVCFVVATDRPTAVDQWAANAMPGWSCHLTSLGVVLSALGYEYGVLPVSALLPIMLAVRRQWSHAAFAAFVLLGSLWLNQALKYLFDRVRPAWMPCIPEPGSNSFPSGHAMATASLISVLLLIVPRLRRPVPGAVLAILGVSIGAARVLLGVHFPTDVLAGWCFGIAWVCGSYCITTFLPRTPANA